MKLPTFMKHLKVLEESGVVRSHKSGRVRTCEMRPQRLAQAEKWIEKYRSVWESRLDRLEAFLSETEQQER